MTLFGFGITSLPVCSIKVDFLGHQKVVTFFQSSIFRNGKVIEESGSGTSLDGSRVLSCNGILEVLIMFSQYQLTLRLINYGSVQIRHLVVSYLSSFWSECSDMVGSFVISHERLHFVACVQFVGNI